MTLDLPVATPRQAEPREFTEPGPAVAYLKALYADAVDFLAEGFRQTLAQGAPGRRYRAHYPEVRLRMRSFAPVDSRLSFGHVTHPGVYAATITRPDLFENYLTQQIGLVQRNHGVPVTVGPSDTPMPLHFALAGQSVPQEGALTFPLRDVFDVPDLSTTNDDIVNGTVQPAADGAMPLAPFTAQRVDYSLARLAHYTATDPEHFQNPIRELRSELSQERRVV
jgi:AMP nucleosidase